MGNHMKNFTFKQGCAIYKVLENLGTGVRPTIQNN